MQGGAASGRFGCVRCPAGLTRDLGVDAAHVGEVAGSGRAGLPAVVAGSLVAGLLGPVAIAAWALTPPRSGSRVADHAVEPSPEGSRPAAQQGGVILPPGQTHGGRLHVQGRLPALTPRR